MYAFCDSVMEFAESAMPWKSCESVYVSHKRSKSFCLGMDAFASALIVAMFSSTVSAQNLSELLPELMLSHQLVKASESDLSAATERTREARGGFFPNLNVAADYGREVQNKPFGAADTSMVGRRVDVSITQLLYDFGATGAVARSAKLTRDAAADNLEATKQQLMLRGITAFLNVRRSALVVLFARQSVDNIRKQAELEDALVRRGAGLSTDALQAKTQLAGAEARRVQSEGALNINRNIYRTVFGADPGNLNSMVRPKLPLDLLPQTVNEGVGIAVRENPQLTAAESGALVTRENLKTAASLFLPRIDAIAQSVYKEDSGGAVGHQQEMVGKLTLSFPFNLGFTAMNTLNAAENDTSAVDQRLIEARRVVEEQVRNSWQNMLTARENSRLLRNQANIAAEFLELARKERQLGNRSLLDVLAGETALINANSDATSAETDVAIATYTLLQAMGRLKLDTIRE